MNQVSRNTGLTFHAITLIFLYATWVVGLLLLSVH